MSAIPHPDHVEANHNATHDAIDTADALLLGVDVILELDPLLEDQDRRKAFGILHMMAREAIADAKRLHRAEWVGLGGDSVALSEEEKARARGEHPIN